MSAYSYCGHCGGALLKATAREVIDGVQYCAARHGNTPNLTPDELILDLAARIEALEALEAKVQP